MGNIKIIGGSFDTKLELEHAGVAAGFPSPADEYRHETLDFNRDYIRHPEASFYGDVEGDSMKDAGLLDGDRVIIDRAVEPHDGSIVVAWWCGPARYAPRQPRYASRWPPRSARWERRALRGNASTSGS